MTLTPTGSSIFTFEDVKLEPGIYRIQNFVHRAYIDMQENTRELYCRPATFLEGEDWEVRVLIWLLIVHDS